MRDTMTIALQLHQEAKLSSNKSAVEQLDTDSSHQQMARAVTLQDVELHRRLLQQLYKDSCAFHDIFFALNPAQKVAVIVQDRQVKNDRKSTSSAGHRRCISQALFLCTQFLFKRPVSTNATRRHEYFRGQSRLLPVLGALVSFLELCFLGKMALLALRGPPQPLQKPSPKTKRTFSLQNECAK